jgi:exonuclease SbcC
MRPLRLELKGFTAFRDEQAIDFEGLDLFAISGPTGSGKSSILDALTYALYGYVERIGKQTGQLVSQGQARMAVTLEFEVADERFRVTRSTRAAGGASKILLERWEDGGWRQAGEGADRVRDADAMIRGALGLDYEAFTRSVLLPQGRFAEFLVGDAKDRRAILTELLGLELFERLAKRAGELKRDATIAAETNQRLLETEYVGVSEEAVANADRAVKEAAARDRALAESGARIGAIAERWARTEGEVRELASCANDARQAAVRARQTAEAMEELAPQVADAQAGTKRATKAALGAVKAAEKAASARAKATRAWGRATDLVALRAKAEGLSDAREEIAEVEAELKRARAARPKLEKSLAAAERALATAVADAEGALSALEAAKARLEDARHADLVAAVRAGVRVGDACPVCGARIESLAKTPRAQSLERAEGVLTKAEERAAAANRALTGAERSSDAAERDLVAADRDADRLDKDLAKQRAELAALEGEMSVAMGGKLPPDPGATLDDRLARLERLEEAARTAAEVAAGAKEEVARAEQRRNKLAAEVTEERWRLDGIPTSVLLDRARAAAIAVPALPKVTAAKDAEALGAVAGELADGLIALADALDGRATERAEGEDALLGEALSIVEGLVGPEPSLAELVDSVAEARRRAAAEVATSRKEAETARERLANARKLTEEVAAQRVLAGNFDALSKELRADRIIAFLQVEALQILAAAGSKHLSTLSGGRYGLRFDEDEFFVIDTWNGEEARSARTLSGGETFLASLGLALALSEQVAALSVTEKARLDSLFLDEGFGTLDPETLEVVVEAIEQLGGDGRMIGVITHVQELAIRMPARIDVEKSPRGSRFQVVT